MRKIVAVQARSHSTRLPGKIYLPIKGKPLLQWVVDACTSVGETIVLGPKGDSELEAWCSERKIGLYQGSENDLVDRYVSLLRDFNMDGIVRVTGDCWRVSPEIVKVALDLIPACDYASNTVIRSFAEGLDVQMASKAGWEWFDKNQTTEREHPFAPFDANQTIRDQFVKDGLKFRNLYNSKNEIFIKSSIDTKEEYEAANKTHNPV